MQNQNNKITISDLYKLQQQQLAFDVGSLAGDSTHNYFHPYLQPQQLFPHQLYISVHTTSLGWQKAYTAWKNTAA